MRVKTVAVINLSFLLFTTSNLSVLFLHLKFKYQSRFARFFDHNGSPTDTLTDLFESPVTQVIVFLPNFMVGRGSKTSPVTTNSSMR